MKVRISRLRCRICGHVFPIPREKTAPRAHGHIKTLHCIRCKVRTEHVEDVYSKY